MKRQMAQNIENQSPHNMYPPTCIGRYIENNFHGATLACGEQIQKADGCGLVLVGIQAAASEIITIN